MEAAPPMCSQCKTHLTEIQINGRNLCYNCAIVGIALSTTLQLPPIKRERTNREQQLIACIEAFWERTLAFVESKPEVIHWMKQTGYGPNFFRASIVVPALQEWIKKNR